MGCREKQSQLQIAAIFCRKRPRRQPKPQWRRFLFLEKSQKKIRIACGFLSQEKNRKAGKKHFWGPKKLTEVLLMERFPYVPVADRAHPTLRKDRETD